MKQFFAILVVIAAIIVGTARPVLASPISIAGTYAAQGGATGGATGPWELTSVNNQQEILDFTPTGTVTFGDISNITIDYDVISDGLPTEGFWENIWIDDGGQKDIKAYFALPSVSGSASSGNLIGDDSGIFDTTAIGGTTNDTYTDLLSLVSGDDILRLDTVLQTASATDVIIDAPSDLQYETGSQEPVPEPTPIVLIGAGIVALTILRRRL